MICSFSQQNVESLFFADDNSLCSCGMNLGYIFTILIHILKTCINGLYTIQWKQILKKIQFILLWNTGSHKLEIGDITTESVQSGITIDSELNFKEL